MSLTFLAITIISITILFFIGFIYYKPTNLWTGFSFVLLISELLIIIIIYLEKINSNLAFIVSIPILLLLFFIMTFGFTITIIYLFWNERTLLKKESFSFSHLLPLITGIALVILQLSSLLFAYYSQNKYIISLSFLITVSSYYLIGLILFYFITSLLYNKCSILKNTNYIIILGAGLINGNKVTPLLAGRIDIGVKLYLKQVEKYNHYPTIILSGGKGSDEKISEAQAMMNYIQEKNYVIKKIYLETQSKNTKENLKFSENIACQKDNIPDFKNKKIVIASSNYHTLRAGKIAYNLGFKARAVGSKTKLYYLPTAFIREYIGYLQITKKRNIMILCLIFIFSIIPSLVL